MSHQLSVLFATMRALRGCSGYGHHACVAFSFVLRYLSALNIKKEAYTAFHFFVTVVNEMMKA